VRSALFRRVWSTTPVEGVLPSSAQSAHHQAPRGEWKFFVGKAASAPEHRAHDPFSKALSICVECNLSHLSPSPYTPSPSEEDAMPTTHLCGKVMKPNSAIPGAVAGRLPLRTLSRGLLSRQALGGTRLRVSETTRNAQPQRSARKEDTHQCPPKPEPSRATNKASTALPYPCLCAGSDGERRFEEFHQRETQLC